jgi:hypothetical protein
VKRPFAVNAACVDAQTFNDAVKGLRLYFQRYGLEADELPFVAARYEFVLRRVRPSLSEIIYEWQVVPLGGQVERDEYTGEPKAKRFPTPRVDVVEVVPNDPRLAYRGMAWEEWQFIREKGYIESSGSYNLDQPGLTFCGDAAMAEHYASSFAPLAYKPAWRRPGVVIAIPRGLVLHHDDVPDKIPPGECAVRGRLPADVIVAVWYLIPTRIRFGRIEVVEVRGRGIREGSRSSPSVSYVVLPAAQPRPQR